MDELSKAIPGKVLALPKGSFPCGCGWGGGLGCLNYSNKLKRRIFHLKPQRPIATFSMTLHCEDVKRCWDTGDVPFLQEPLSGGCLGAGSDGLSSTLH